MSDQLSVRTPAGPARVTFHRAIGEPWCLLLAGHGAGGGIEARDLVALAEALPAQGVTVGLVEQPWRVAGKKVAPAPARLDEGWRAVMAALGAAGETDGLTVVAAGRSAGARVACRVGRETGADAVLALSFPLHPPGRPERSRAGELLGVKVPVLVLQGERDPFGRPEEFPALPEGDRLVPVPGGDHGFAVLKRAAVTQRGALDALTRAAADWLSSLRP
jgi:hypothetical protein